jgi:hypothetical protein
VDQVAAQVAVLPVLLAGTSLTATLSGWGYCSYWPSGVSSHSEAAAVWGVFTGELGRVCSRHRPRFCVGFTFACLFVRAAH